MRSTALNVKTLKIFISSLIVIGCFNGGGPNRVSRSAVKLVGGFQTLIDWLSGSLLLVLLFSCVV